ncbi:MAG: PTS glucose transporter subunit IIA [Erysipelothrix sp.]|nr:PTS glucose transporter subunit IIA [Erysipelothrix sp.]
MFFSKKVDKNLVAFMDGTMVALEKVADPVFAEKMMGDGFAIEPTSNDVFAPCDGEITVVFPTFHAYGITREDGVEVLLHLGIDTVELGGEGFTAIVSVGDKVKSGDKLGTMDINRIKELEKPTTSMLIVTSRETVTLLKEDQTVSALEHIATID